MFGTIDKGTLMSNDRHVRPGKAGGWEVAEPGARRPLATAATQFEAVSIAKDIVKKSGGGEVIINNRSGKYTSKDTVRGERGLRPAVRRASKLVR